jgi:hypothetical protein
LSHHGGDADEDFHILGTATGGHRLTADVLHQLARLVLVLRGNEDALGVAGGKQLATVRAAGLKQHRRALARGLAQVVAIQLVERP